MIVFWITKENIFKKITNPAFIRVIWKPPVGLQVGLASRIFQGKFEVSVFTLCVCLTPNNFPVDAASLCQEAV